MAEPIRPVLDGEDPLEAPPGRSRRGPIDPALLRVAPALRRHLLLCVGIALVTTAVVLVQAESISRLLPRLIDGDLDAAVPLAVVLSVLGVMRAALRWVTEMSASVAAARTRDSVTSKAIGRSMVLDERGSAAVPPSRVTTLVTDGVDALDPWIRAYVPALCLAMVLPLAAGARILWADIPSAVVLLVAIPLIPVFMVLIGRLSEDRADRQWAMLQHLAGHFHEVLVGLPTLRLFGRADDQVSGVRRIAERYRVAVMGTLRVAFLSAATMELLASLSVALVAVTIGYRLTTGAVGFSTALVVLLLAPECSLPIRRVGAAFHAAQAGTDAADELHEVLRASTTPDGPVEHLPSPGSGDEPVLRILGAAVVDPERGHRVGPVQVEVHRASVVALVGASGAGKSTLLDAIRCQIPLQRGAVELAGTDVTRLSRAARARSITWISQHPDPVGIDVRSAVAGGARASLAETEQAIAAVDLDGLADRSPEELSGGERQRVAVARALLRCSVDREVRLVLADEPTSHLDAERTALVVEALRAMASSGPAVLVATHDSALIDAADVVVRLEEPRRDPDRRDDPASDRTTSSTSIDRPGGDPDDPVVPAVVSGPLPRVEKGDLSEVQGELDWFHRMRRPVLWRLLGARGLGISTEICTVGLSATAAWMIVRAAQGVVFADLAVAAVMVRVFGIGKGILRYFERLASHDTTFRLLAHVRGAVVARLARLSPGGVVGMGRGDVMARVVDDVDRLADDELRVVGPTVSGIAIGLLAVLGAAAIDPWFGVAYASALVVVAILLPAATRRTAESSAGTSAVARSELAVASLELLEHADELTASRAASPWQERITEAVGRLGTEEVRRGRRGGTLDGVAAAAAALLAAAVVVIDRVQGGTVEGALLGVVVLTPFALMEVLTPLLRAGEHSAEVHTASRRLRTILEAPDPLPEPPHPVVLPEDGAAARHVRLEDATIRWPGADRPVLEHLNLDLVPASRVRIVGPSGSGKSTVAAALVRFIPLELGTYSLDGVDADEVGGDRVRRSVTWCQQIPWLASTSVRENLRLAAPNADDEELWKALDAVQLSDWVVGLPDGLDTSIGRDGQAMSGGQRQRLALARVLLGGQRVVVLDEPTAHLDAGTARLVRRDLLSALGDRTVVELGHGPGTAAAAEGAEGTGEVLVLE